MTDNRQTLDRFFAAMQAGGSAEAEMMALFAEDATYVEPFSGRPRTHRGKEAIRKVMREGWANPLPQMRIEVDRLAVDGASMRAEWTCYSPGLPDGKGRGENLFELRDGAIARLETRFLPPDAKDK